MARSRNCAGSKPWADASLVKRPIITAAAARANRWGMIFFIFGQGSCYRDHQIPFQVTWQELRCSKMEDCPGRAGTRQELSLPAMGRSVLISRSMRIEDFLAIRTAYCLTRSGK